MTEGHRPDSRDQYGGASDGWAALSTLIAGIAVWGGAGYGLDRLLGTSFLVMIGLLVGMASSIYLVYVRSGR
jgi:F0F1-type ATP synthase assembly protein I